MNNIQFSKGFYFFGCNFRIKHHTDNSQGTNVHHIGYIKSGSAIFDCGGKIYEFSSGDVFYTPMGCKYHSYWSGECICYDSYAFSVFPMQNEDVFEIQKLKMNEHAKELLLSLSAHKCVDATSVGLLYLLLGEVLPEMIPTKKSGQSVLISRALAYLRNDYSLDVPSLAKKMNMSESALYLLFQTQINSTPITEKNKIRTEAAIEMLQNTDLAVEEISERLAFSSAAYFRKVLHAFCGKTPRQIRKNDTF